LYSQRNEVEDNFNIGEARFRLAFSWNSQRQKATLPDPKFITFNAMIARRAPDFSSLLVEQAELRKVTRELDADFFTKDSFVEAN